MIRCNLVLAILTAIIAAMFVFNWLVPAPDSSPELHYLYPLGIVLFASSSVLFFGVKRAFKENRPDKWGLQILALVPIALFYAVRFKLLPA